MLRVQADFKLEEIQIFTSSSWPTRSHNTFYAVMFFESDCPFSAEYAPTWREVALEAPAELRVAAIECHENRELCQSLGAARFPTLQYFYGVGDNAQSLDFPEMFEKSVDNVLAFFANAKPILRGEHSEL